MKRFKITEEQYKSALKEGVTLKADVQAANGDVKKAIDTSKQQALKSGVNLNDATIEIDAKDTNENKLISIGELKRKYIIENKKANSELMNFAEVIKRYNLKKIL